jgi:hypothetical protein
VISIVPVAEVFRLSGVGINQMPLHIRSRIAAALLLIAASILCAQPVLAEESEAVGRATELLLADKCAEAWEVLWPLAKGGDAEASSLILIAMYTSLTPPLKDLSDDSFRKTGAFFAVASIPFVKGYPESNEHRFAWLDYIWPLSDPDRSSCVSLTPPAKCMGIAFDRGYAPSVQDFSSAIHSAEIAGISAQCRKDRY